ncbi:MAG: NEW3 domain-containing protein [Thermoleophilia bacterium]
MTAVLLLLLFAPPDAHALDLTTPYPEMSVQPGQTVDLALDVHADQRGRVYLDVVQAPEGWETIVRGTGRTVSAVFAGPEGSPALDLEVNVPENAEKGRHRVVVRATRGSETADLALLFTVADDAVDATTLETEFPSLRGPSDATFRFALTLRNGAPEERTYNVSVEAPEGWHTSLVPATSERETPTVTVEGGSHQRLNLDVTPPATVEAGDYPVTVRAATGGEEEVLELTITITGTYDLSVTTPDERLNATVEAGGETRIPLILRNQGSGAITNVNLSAVPPTDWAVSFEPEVVDLVPAGDDVPITAVFEPAEGAIAGDYVVTVEAEGDQDAVSTDFRVTVETSTLWGLAGVAVIALALVGLVVVFRRYGRR